MENLKDVAKLTTKIAASAIIPGAAAVIAGKEVYDNCSDEEKGTVTCAMKVVGAGLLAQGIMGL